MEMSGSVNLPVEKLEMRAFGDLEAQGANLS